MKGFTNTVEALIGAIIVLSVMLFLFVPGGVQEQDLYNTVYNCLKYSKDYENMEANFSSCIPSSYDYVIKTCGPGELGNCFISGMEDRTVVSADYVDSGPELIKVWVYK